MYLNSPKIHLKFNPNSSQVKSKKYSGGFINSTSQKAKDSHVSNYLELRASPPLETPPSEAKLDLVASPPLETPPSRAFCNKK